MILLIDLFPEVFGSFVSWNLLILQFTIAYVYLVPGGKLRPGVFAWAPMVRWSGPLILWILLSMDFWPVEDPYGKILSMQKLPFLSLHVNTFCNSVLTAYSVRLSLRVK